MRLKTSCIDRRVPTTATIITPGVGAGRSRYLWAAAIESGLIGGALLLCWLSGALH
jgi:hypothetical protein